MTRGRVAGLIVAVVVATGGCGSGSSRSEGGPRGSEPSASEGPAPAEAPQHEVARVETTFVDRTRPTVATPGVTEAADERRIPAVVFHPSDDPGPFPLVVHNHGINTTAAASADFLAAVARAGYVVAGIDPPETSAGVGFEGVRHHTFHPADLSFVIDELLHPSSGLPPGIVDPERIAVAGHSHGAAGAYALAFNSCCRQDRIDAVLAFSGSYFERPDEAFDWRGPPLLMVYGERDPLVPLSIATGILDELTTPGYLLTVRSDEPWHGALHEGDLGHDEVLAAVVEFLALHLRDDPATRPAVLVDGWTGEHGAMTTNE